MRPTEDTATGSGLRPAASVARALEAGTICLGRYRLGRRLGQGGYAEVYQATRLTDGVEVAVKALLTRTDGGQFRSRDRMLVEGHLTLDLKHPNLVQYLEVGEDHGVLVLVMELVGNGDAESLPRFHRGRVPAQIIATIGRDAARGLQALHDHGLLHRDVKPANLMLGTAGICKVGDFGLIRPMVDPGTITQDGYVVGTPAYLAPEQARNARSCDHRADVYGLGASLYHLATGQPPHESSNIWAMLTSLVTDPFPDPRDLRPDLPEDLARIILQAGAKDPDLRYTSAAAMGDALDAFLVGAPLPGSILPLAMTPVIVDDVGPTVLLVDDDPMVRRLYAGRLKLDGFQVMSAATPDEALAAAAHTAPRVVVLDLYLGHDDGSSLLRQLRNLPGLALMPVVVFSNALANDDRRHRVQSLGVTRFLAKASTPPRLLSLLLDELLGVVEETRRLATDPEPVADLDGVARTALVHLGALLADLGRGNPVASQASLLCGIAETARGVSSSAAASGRSALAAMAEGAEHLARRLADEDEAITSSLHRTLAQAVDRMRGLVSDLTPAAPAPWRPGQTLVVDDDRLAARYATKALEKVHVPVTTVHDPQAALRLLDEHAFSLLVSDVCMAGMAGDELAKRVRAHPRYATVPIIFVTACADFTFRLPDGTDSDVIAKPYQMAELAVKALTHLTSLR